MNSDGYKETEIGLIPEDWEVKTLKNLLKGKGYIRGPFGSALRRNELQSKGIPVYEQQHAINNHRNFRYFIDDAKFRELSRFTVKDRDLIISCSGNVGKISLINKEDPKGIISQALLILRPNYENILPEYLRYFFTSKKGHESLISRSGGSVQVNLAKKQIIQQIKIPTPPLKEQKQIIEILSSLDDKIELNKKMNQILEAIDQVIFHHWFVDFDFPNENGQPYKSTGGDMVDSELGDIPVGWEVKSLDKVADYLNGLALQKYPVLNDEYLPVIKIRELKQGITAQTDKASIDVPIEYIIDDGDVIFSWSGSLEVVIWGSGKGALNQHLFKVSSKEFPKWFYYYQTLGFLPSFRQTAEDKATTMGHIKRSHLSESLVAVPDEGIIKKADKILNPILEEIINNKINSRYLASIRNSLLPKLMSGKIRVNKLMEEV